MDLHYLIDDHLDGELTGDGALQLSGWLRASDDNVRQFTRQWLIHSLLHDYISQRQVQADVLLRAMTTPQLGTQTASIGESLATLGPRGPRTPREEERGSILNHVSRLRYRFAGLAAIMCITLAVGALAYLATQPKVVAMLTQSANCRWESADESIADGALLREGDTLRLAAGRALVTFGSGARMVIEGPTAVTIESKSAAALATGTLGAKVPSQAIGFTVHTPLGQLVDLGTEFAVRMRADQSFDLQVFDGLVELRVRNQNNELDDAPLRISEGVAVKVDAQTRDVKAIDYDAGQRMTMP